MANGMNGILKYIEDTTDHFSYQYDNFEAHYLDFDGCWELSPLPVTLEEMKDEDFKTNLLWIILPMSTNNFKLIVDYLDDSENKIDCIITVEHRDSSVENQIKEIPILKDWEIDTVRDISETYCTITWFRKDL